MSGRIAYYGNIVKDSLVLDLDAAKKDSYPRSGTTWRDISGNGINGTLTNGPIYTGSNGGALVFDGIDDYIDLGNTSLGIAAGSSQITLEAWIYPIVFLSFTGIIARSGTTAPYGGWQLNLNNASGVNRFDFAVNISGTWQTWVTLGGSFSPALTTNTWYNVVGVYNGASLSMYLNGSLVSSQASAGTIQYAAGMNNLFVGRNNAAYSTSRISVARVYNRALNATQVLQNYNALKSRYL